MNTEKHLPEHESAAGERRGGGMYSILSFRRALQHELRRAGTALLIQDDTMARHVLDTAKSCTRTAGDALEAHALLQVIRPRVEAARLRRV